MSPIYAVVGTSERTGISELRSVHLSLSDAREALEDEVENFDPTFYAVPDARIVYDAERGTTARLVDRDGVTFETWALKKLLVTVTL